MVYTHPIKHDVSHREVCIKRHSDWEFPRYPCPKNVSRLSNFSKWLSHYHHTVVNTYIARDKAAIALMATTETGTWNCRPDTMRQRAAQMLADGVPELAIFELFPGPKGKCSSSGNTAEECTCSDARTHGCRWPRSSSLEKLALLRLCEPPAALSILSRDQ